MPCWASLEQNASGMQADARVKAEQLMADLHKKRDEFQDAFRKQTEAGEVAWSRAKAQLETQWNSFETEARKYVETFGKQIEQQQTIFQQVAAAQLKAWRDAADKMLSATADLATDRRADIDATVKRMQASASEAEATFQKLSRAGAESWASLNDALVTSRAAFDRANQAAWDAFKRAVKSRRLNSRIMACSRGTLRCTSVPLARSRPCSAMSQGDPFAKSRWEELYALQAQKHWRAAHSSWWIARSYADRSGGGIAVSAKTVGELRKATSWPENLVITTPQEHYPESVVRVSKASVATHYPPRR